MKNFVTKTAVIACLLGPVLANAEATTTTYTGNTDIASTTLILPSLSNVGIGYSWSDMLLSKNGNIAHEINATLLGWSLSGVSSQSGSFTDTDVTGQLTGLGTISLSNLAAGTYTLTLTGVWNNVTLTGNGNSGLATTAGTVGLGTKSVSAVPEPESYAMLLAGLGLMGTIVRRRNQDKAA